MHILAPTAVCKQPLPSRSFSSPHKALIYPYQETENLCLLVISNSISRKIALLPFSQLGQLCDDRDPCMFPTCANKMCGGMARREILRENWHLPISNGPAGGEAVRVLLCLSTYKHKDGRYIMNILPCFKLDDQ